MKNILILFFLTCITGTNNMTCSDSNRSSVNPNNYQSFYTCKDRCLRLDYCQSSAPYFSDDTQNCSPEPTTWIPRYYLTGAALSSKESASIIYVRQDGFQLFWTLDDRTASYTFTGQYINETYVQGINSRRVVTTNCINVFDVRVIATADRNFCATYSLHPQSALCDLPYPYEYTLCQNLTL